MTTPEQRIVEALDTIKQFGDIDGAHHKQWVLDQVVRVLTGCPILVKEANPPGRPPYTYEVLGESEEYLAWVAEHNAGDHGPNTYEWDEGAVP